MGSGGKSVVDNEIFSLSFKRMLDKKTVPTEDEINEHIGNKAVKHIETIKNCLSNIFEIQMELKFPFGNNYGWGYKVSNKSKHLFYLFFEKDSINIMLQIKKKIEKENEIEKYNNLSEEGKEYWKDSYPCGENGGWIHYRILNKKHLKDMGIFLSVKTKKEINLWIWITESGQTTHNEAVEFIIWPEKIGKIYIILEIFRGVLSKF